MFKDADRMIPRRMVKEMAQPNKVKRSEIAVACRGRGRKRLREGTLWIYYGKPNYVMT